MKLAASVLILVTFVAPPAFAEMVGQGANVTDGDTFDLAMPDHMVKIRICGIDAPEGGRPGSREAWAALSALVHGKTVRCIQVGQPPGTVCDHRSRSTNRDRIVAQCFVDGQDIAVELVRNGNACDWQKFSGGHYQSLTGGKACAGKRE
ncbi:thermonuclease family protein [Bradyrhizobium huanghuaihaiense]|uniref:thermonuclease family protein n=1 Tax=Bradyrhizobium huanghuaihaiense TaxID=990078 RepID=UPI0021AADBD7|nr:thermonuclease family protein [Bradyrhizobium sp. CB3035]UWU80720.1 thermonuclease family protein [Bradyrhizobium sp. CB3035]